MLHKSIHTPPAYGICHRDGSPYPQWITFVDIYKVLSLPLLPPKTKETAFQVLSHTLWTQSKAHKSGHAATAHCLCCKEIETIEHLLQDFPHHAAKVWPLAGRSLTKALAQYSGGYVPPPVLTPLEFVYNKLLFATTLEGP